MKFCLMINASDRWSESIQNAYSLAKSITDDGHTINTVFFYGQAVKVIEHPEQLKPWLDWQHNHEVSLQLCSSFVETHQLTAAASQVDGIQVVSLGSWVMAVETADKTLELC